LGVNYNQPPMPITAPFVMTWATVPTVLLVLGIGGIIWASIADLRRPDGDRGPDGGSLAASDGLLGAIFVLVPIALIAWPTTPIFGGTKHWITAYPFLALGGAFAWQRLWQHAQLRVHRTARPIAAAMCLGPALWATVDGHPYNLSQYAPAIGGPRGAAALGLNRGFWGYNGLPLLQELEPRSAVYIHDMHPLAVTQLKRENRWPNQLRSTSLSRAAAGLLFHERHMITYEVELWSQTERTAPSAVLTLDDIPLTSLYER
jgi:hypothetical protein